MSNFVTLTCPNCGAQLTSKAGQSSVRCEYCGTEHLLAGKPVGEPAPASGAVYWQPEKDTQRCPVCHHAGALESLDQYVHTPVHVRSDSTVRHLLLPAAPTPPMEPVRQTIDQSKSLTGLTCVMLIGIFIVICGILSGISTLSYNGSLDEKIILWLPGLFILILGSLIIAVTVKMLNDQDGKKGNPLVEKYEKQYQAEMAIYHQKMSEYTPRMKEYLEKQKIWQEMEYCARDHIICLPSASLYIRDREMNSLLHSEWLRRYQNQA